MSLVLQASGCPVEYSALIKQLAKNTASDIFDIAHIASKQGCQAGIVECIDLHTLPCPCIIELVDGSYCVLARTEGDRALLSRSTAPAPKWLSIKDVLQMCSGRAILIKVLRLHTEALPFGYRWLWLAFSKHMPALLMVLGLSALIQLIALTAPFVTQSIIDNVLVHRSHDTLNTLLLASFAAVVFSYIFGLFRTLAFSYSVGVIDSALASRVFSHLLRLPLRYFEKRATGEIAARLNEVNKIRQFLSSALCSVVLDTLFTAIYIAILFYYSPQLAGLTLAVIACFATLSAVLTPYYYTIQQKVFAAESSCQATLIQTVNGILSIKTSNACHEFTRQFDSKLAAVCSANFSLNKLRALASSIGQLLQQLVNVSVLWLGITLVLEHRMSLGQLVAFQMIAALLLEPVLRMTNLWQSAQRARVSVRRTAEIMLESPEHSGQFAELDVHGDIALKNVCFAYDDKPVLQSVSMHIPLNKKTAIVGRSGSGKSTIAKLLQNIYQPQSGQVTIGSYSVSDYALCSLRRSVGMVTQETRLFRGTIRENILLGNPAAPECDWQNAAKIALVSEFVDKLPARYDTVIGENGSELSGGQRQRIAIARALITNPRIIVLDEATAALDVESEREVMPALTALTGGRTVIAIAHKLDSIRDFDLIYVLDEGRIVQQGNHDMLYAEDGVYRELWQAQNC